MVRTCLLTGSKKNSPHLVSQLALFDLLLLKNTEEQQACFEKEIGTGFFLQYSLWVS